jgi:hypothetical protein
MYDNMFRGISMVKYANQRHVIFLENIHKLYFNILNPWILFKSMINNYNFFDFIT